jgi:hypothetical protein
LFIGSDLNFITNLKFITMGNTKEQLLKELSSLGGQIEIYVVEAVHYFADYPYHKDVVGYCLTEDKAKSMVNGIIKSNEDIAKKLNELEEFEGYDLRYGIWDDPSYRNVTVVL